MPDLYQEYKNRLDLENSMKNYDVFLRQLCSDSLIWIEGKIFFGIKNLQKSIEVDRIDIKIDPNFKDTQRVSIRANQPIKYIDLPIEESKNTKTICKDYGEVLNNLMINKGYSNFKIMTKMADEKCIINVDIDFSYDKK